MVGVLHRIEDGGTLLAALRTSGRERSLAARQELTAPGDDTALVSCFSGALKVERHLRDGRRFVSEFLHPDETVILRDRWHLEETVSALAHRQSVDGRRAWLPMNYDDLADHLGLTRETVARRVAELRRAGTVEWRDGKRTVLAILDPVRLTEIAG